MQFKNNSKQRNGSIQGLRSFKDTLPKNIKKVINKKGYIYSETLNNWKYIVGEDLFNICYSKSTSWPLLTITDQVLTVSLVVLLNDFG